MKKFRKKPVVIEAVQVSFDNVYEAQDWANGQLPEDHQITLSFSNDEDWRVDGLIVPTLEGPMRCSFGDYLIRGVKGEFYPCKPDIFEMTYEQI